MPIELPAMLEEARRELDHRRRREFQVFAWSSAISIGLIGILVFTTATPPFFEAYGARGRLLVSVLLLILAGFSISWQGRQRQKAGSAVRALGNILEKMGAFDDEQFNGEGSLYPPDWKRREDEGATLLSQLTVPSKILATALLALIGIVGIWLPKV